MKMTSKLTTRVTTEMSSSVPRFSPPAGSFSWAQGGRLPFSVRVGGSPHLLTRHADASHMRLSPSQGC